jgi:predicted AlkP superfamily phosphohydrolase/phosphomutase
MQVWTSIVTGKLPGQHGIWDHVKNSWYNPPGFRTKKRGVYTPADRRSRALWQLLGDRGLKTLVVGWPTTWPAEEVPHGIVVAPKVLYGDDRRVTIKGNFWRHVDDMVSPAALLPRVREQIVESQEITAEEVATLADVPPAGSPLYELPRIESYVHALRWNLARARSVEAVTLDLAASERPDVILAYFQCTDSLLHRFWIFQKTEEEIRARLRQFKIPVDHVPELKRRFGKVVENCYRDVDARVGRMLDALRADETLVMLVSDHGFGDGPRKHPFRAEPYGGIHWSTGAMIVAGPGIPADPETDPDASVLDVTPTILYFLGLPVAGDMRGKVLEVLFGPAALEKRPIETVPTYEDEPQLLVPYPEGFPPKPPSFIW